MIFIPAPVQKVTDTRVVSSLPLPSPSEMAAQMPRTEKQLEFVGQARREIHDIIHQKDKRLMTVVGPCSIHDLEAGLEYAEKLRELAEELGRGGYLEDPTASIDGMAEVRRRLLADAGEAIDGDLGGDLTAVVAAHAVGDDEHGAGDNERVLVVSSDLADIGGRAGFEGGHANSITCSPTWMRSPGPTFSRWSRMWSFTSVPFVEPRSTR